MNAYKFELNEEAKAQSFKKDCEMLGYSDVTLVHYSWGVVVSVSCALNDPTPSTLFDKEYRNY